MKKRDGDGGERDGLVYSSEQGSMCPVCRFPVASCVCRGTNAPRRDGVVRVGRETQGRKGKGVTVISGVALDSAALAALAAELKRKCGSGGTVKDGTIEIQGDHRDALVRELETRGWKVKRAGA
jgi:translation initiation factor 1